MGHVPAAVPVYSGGNGHSIRVHIKGDDRALLVTFMPIYASVSCTQTLE